MKKLVKSLIAVCFAISMSIAPSMNVNASEAETHGVSPRTKYDWHTNPNGHPDNAIWISPVSYAKVPGPYWGGFVLTGTGEFTVSWNGADSRTCPTVTLEDGGNGNVIDAVTICGESATFKLRHKGQSSNGAANIWIYNNSNESYGFWDIHVKTSY